MYKVEVRLVLRLDNWSSPLLIVNIQNKESSTADWLWLGENDISEPWPSRAYCSSLGWMWMESHGDEGAGWGWLPDLSTRACWQSYQQRHLEQVRGMDEGMRILHIQYLWYINGAFTCRKTLWHRTSGFTYHPKEGVLRIFITLKIHCLSWVWTSDPWV
jgi:hypothetical protein